MCLGSMVTATFYSGATCQGPQNGTVSIQRNSSCSDGSNSTSSIGAYAYGPYISCYAPSATTLAPSSVVGPTMMPSVSPPTMAPSNTSSFSWAILQLYSDALCTQSNITTASLVGLNTCYATSSNLSTSHYVMATVSSDGTSVLYRHYSDSACTAVLTGGVDGNDTYPLNSCLTSPYGPGSSGSANAVLSLSSAFAYSYPGIVSNYYASQSQCDVGVGGLVTSTYTRVSSSGCLYSDIGSGSGSSAGGVGSTSTSVSCSGNKQMT